MAPLSWLLKKLTGLHRLSKISVKLGLTMMVFFYIVAALSRLLAPHVPDYFYAMAVHYASLEAAPASLAVGVCAGLLGDLMLRSRNSGDDAR